MIHLAEIQAFSDGENVAASGKATQSSTGYGGEAKRVNDGNTNGDYQENSVSHTASSTDPWVEIDLGSKPCHLTAWSFGIELTAETQLSNACRDIEFGCSMNPVTWFGSNRLPRFPRPVRRSL